MNQVEIAKQIATEAHEGQTRWDGTPYIKHPEAVAKVITSESWDEGVVAAAWLHDVFEDTDTTPESVVERGVSERAVDFALAVTRDKENETYAESMLRIIEHRDSGPAAIKRADLNHNLSDLGDGKKHQQRRDKYQLARSLMELRLYGKLVR